MIDSESNVEVDQGHMLVLDLWLSTPWVRFMCGLRSSVSLVVCCTQASFWR
jgi:hypothetical protein